MTVIGAEISLRNGPIRAWTRTKISDTHSSDTNPPLTDGVRSAAASPIATATRPTR